MFLDVRIVVIPVTDLERAIRWYRQVLNFAPHHVTASSASFNGGGYDLRLELERRPRGRAVSRASVVYWRVHDLERTVAKLVRAGAKRHAAPSYIPRVGVTASVRDPFGTVIGLIEEREVAVFNPAA